MKIGIVGYGYVGKAMTRFFARKYAVCVRDTQPVTVHDVPGDVAVVSREDINKCDLGVVCVPTPRAEDGACDLSAVRAVVDWLTVPLILIKSTVEVGTTTALRKVTGKRIVFSPEYAGESNYWSPYAFDTEVVETPFFIFGGEPQDTQALVDVFMPIGGPTKKYLQTDSTTAEIVKYMENSFFATKIAFCYEMAEICRKVGVDYNTVRELWLQDPRINPMHTAVFADNVQPFSGKCLPKDISALKMLADKAGYLAGLLQEVIATNGRIAKIRQTRKDAGGN